MPRVKTKFVEINNVYTKDDPETWEISGEWRRRNYRGRSLKHLCAGGRRACNDPRQQVQRPHCGAAHPVLNKSSVGDPRQWHAAHAPRFVPQPVMGKTAGELRAYIDGIDPVTAGR